VAKGRHELRLGKGVAFVKGRWKRLRQENDTGEADFQALPKPILQSQTHSRGMVVALDGSFLADCHVEGRSTVNNMATLLAHAMRRPLTGKAHRPRHIHVRGHPQWKELFPHLDELAIKVAVHRELLKVQRAYEGCQALGASCEAFLHEPAAAREPRSGRPRKTTETTDNSGVASTPREDMPPRQSKPRERKARRPRGGECGTTRRRARRALRTDSKRQGIRREP
jgi:hypothetical protein